MLLQQLLTFCRVVEEGSITRAADHLRLSQPAVTKQVARLEAEIGTRLINRSGRQLRLTPAGRQVYAYARRIFNTVTEMRAAVEGLTSPGRGLVRVSCVTTLGLWTLPDLLGAYTHRYPEVHVQVMTGNIQDTVDLLLHEEADVGLVTTPIHHPRLDARPLFPDPVLLVASPRQAANLPQPLSLSLLGSLGMICYQAPSNFRTYVDGVLEQLGVYPRVLMEFDSHEAVKTMVRAGLGVAMVPLSAVAEDLQAGRLISVPVEGLPPMSRMTTLVLRRDRPRLPAVEHFAEVAVERLRQLERPPGDTPGGAAGDTAGGPAGGGAAGGSAQQ